MNPQIVDAIDPSPVELATTELLRSSRQQTDSVELARAHFVLVPTSGAGYHMVDFDEVEVAPGRALHVQPGQVHRFDRRSCFEAVVLQVVPSGCPQGLFDPSRLQPFIELGADFEIVSSVVASLLAEQQRDRSSMQVLLVGAAFVLHHMARASGADEAPGSTPHHELVRRFRAEVEVRFWVTRNVSVYASAIGTSTKTLARATVGLAGLAPKEIIDRRVVLEAKRRLVYGAEPIAGIGASLGFSEATNFTKFFVRMTGTTPHNFRR